MLPLLGWWLATAEAGADAVYLPSPGQVWQRTVDWWREAERVDRAGFLRAYYAEFGGQMAVTFATVSPCISCSGEGTVPELGGDGRIVRNKCFLCHDTKWLRSFKAY